MGKEKSPEGEKRIGTIESVPNHRDPFTGNICPGGGSLGTVQQVKANGEVYINCHTCNRDILAEV